MSRPRLQRAATYRQEKIQPPVMGRLVHTVLGSSSFVAHVLHYPPPPREQVYNRYYSNTHNSLTSDYRYHHKFASREWVAATPITVQVDVLVMAGRKEMF